MAALVPVAGVDGCRRGWVAAIDEPTRPLRIAGFATFRELLQSLPRGALVAIDIPIGLPEAGTRACDREAARRLGARRSSVFPAPLRPMLAARSHEEACAIRRAIEGKGASLQVFHILRKIAEVDEALAAHPAWQRRVHEVHPELCFTRLNGGAPLGLGKKGVAGREERLALLLGALGAEAVALAAQRPRPLGCAPDDVLDALAALTTARRLLDGSAEIFPSRPPRDARGLRMAMAT